MTDMVCFSVSAPFTSTKRLLKQVGPIVRISPHEIHINDPNDPDFYFQLNQFTPGIDKCPDYYNSSTLALVTTSDHKMHHQWRSAVRSFYSVTEANTSCPTIVTAVQTLCGRLQKCAMLSASESGMEVVNMSAAFRALTYDIICAIYLSSDPSTLTEADFGARLHSSFGEFTRVLSILRQMMGGRLAAAMGGAGRIGFYALGLLPSAIHRRAIGWTTTKGQSIIHLQQVSLLSFALMYCFFYP